MRSDKRVYSKVSQLMALQKRLLLILSLAWKKFSFLQHFLSYSLLLMEAIERFLRLNFTTFYARNKSQVFMIMKTTYKHTSDVDSFYFVPILILILLSSLSLTSSEPQNQMLTPLKKRKKVIKIF